MTTLVDAIEAAKAARAERHTQVDQGKEAGQERLQELKKALLLRSPSGFSFEFAPEGLSVSSSTAVIGYWSLKPTASTSRSRAHRCPIIARRPSRKRFSGPPKFWSGCG